MKNQNLVSLDRYEREFLKILASLDRPATRDDVGVTTSGEQYRARQRCRRLLLASFKRKTTVNPAGWVITARGKKVYNDPQIGTSISQPKQ